MLKEDGRPLTGVGKIEWKKRDRKFKAGETSWSRVACKSRPCLGNTHTEEASVGWADGFLA